MVNRLELDLLEQIEDLIKERDDLLDKCVHKNTTIGVVLGRLEGVEYYAMDNLAEYIKERENFD